VRGIEVRVGVTTAIVLPVRRGATLSVRAAATSRTDAFELWCEDVCIVSRRIDLWNARDHVVPAGRVLIRKHSSVGWSEESIEVKAGEKRELVLDS
jgi:hypothetical protein